MTATSTPTDRHRPVTLWRLEVLRLVRTHRWLIVVGVFLLFGAVGPLTARYINEILDRFGDGMTVFATDPRPVDGIVQFVTNASQIGLLAVVVVAASALTVDAKPELAAFVRTKVAHPGRLIVAPYSVTLGIAAVALTLGTLLAWVLTDALIGALPAGAMVVGTLYGILWLAFVVAVVAAVASHVRGQAMAVFAALAALLVLPIVGIADPLQPWLPSTLATAVAGLVDGARAGDFTRAVATTLAATLALLLWAARRMERREL